MSINEYKKIIDKNLDDINCDVKMQSIFSLINSDQDLSQIDRQDLLKYLTYSTIDILKGYSNHLKTDIKRMIEIYGTKRTTQQVRNDKLNQLGIN